MKRQTGVRNIISLPTSDIIIVHACCLLQKVQLSCLSCLSRSRTQTPTPQHSSRAYRLVQVLPFNWHSSAIETPIAEIAYHPSTTPASQLWISRARFNIVFGFGTRYRGNTVVRILVTVVAVAPAFIAILHPEMRNGVSRVLVLAPLETVLENKNKQKRRRQSVAQEKSNQCRPASHTYNISIICN